MKKLVFVILNTMSPCINLFADKTARPEGGVGAHVEVHAAHVSANITVLLNRKPRLRVQRLLM